MRNLVLWIATGAGSGYVPVAPGTVGSIVGAALFVLFVAAASRTPALAGVDAGLASVAVSLGGLAVVLGIGVWAAGRAEQIFATKDDPRITIDEVAGVWLALTALPLRVEVVVAGVALFRLFDIWKPAPVRRCERLRGGLGVMADDLAAGACANLVGQLLWRVGPRLIGGVPLVALFLLGAMGGAA